MPSPNPKNNAVRRYGAGRARGIVPQTYDPKDTDPAVLSVCHACGRHGLVNPKTRLCTGLVEKKGRIGGRGRPTRIEARSTQCQRITEWKLSKRAPRLQRLIALLNDFTEVGRGRDEVSPVCDGPTTEEEKGVA